MAGETTKAASLGNTKIMIIGNNKPLAAISYDTQAYGLVKQFTMADGVDVVKISPEEFAASPSTDFQYVNLVVKDWDERARISAKLDQLNLDRWSYIGEPYTAQMLKEGKISVGSGSVIFPMTFAYSGAIGQDAIIHSMVKIAENVSIGNGCYISGGVTIAGSCKIGNRCYLGNNLFIIDHINLCNDVRLLPGTNVRKNITKAGTYYNPNTFKIESIMI